MTKGQIADAERRALHELDRWNDVTGFMSTGSGTWYEIQAIVEDAVHIGIQMALNGKVEYDDNGDVIKQQ